MSEWQIALYETNSLWNHCDTEYGDGFRAQKRAKTYIEGAFEAIRNQYPDVPNHTVDVLTPTQTPNAPSRRLERSSRRNIPATSDSVISTTTTSFCGSRTGLGVRTIPGASTVPH